MKKTALLALTALTSLVSVSAHAVSQIRCDYKFEGNYQSIVIEHQVRNRNTSTTVPFLWHEGDSKFGTYDIQFITATNNDKRLQNWTYVKAYSDIEDTTLNLDIQNGRISIEQQGKVVLKNARLSCKFNQGGE